MTSETREMREKRKAIAVEMRQMVTDLAGKKWEAEHNQKWDTLNGEYNNLDVEITRRDNLTEIENRLGEVKDADDRASFHPNPKRDRISAHERSLATRAVFLGEERASPEMKAAAEKCKVRVSNAAVSNITLSRPRLREAPRSVNHARELIAEARASSNAMGKGTTGEGADTVANNLMASVEMWLVAFGGMRTASRIIRRDSGATLPIPIWNDSSSDNMGALLAENTATTVNTVPTGQVTMSAKKYTSRLIPVSLELLQDTSIDLEMLLGEAIGTRIGRIQNQHFTVGPASGGNPMGVVDASTNSSLVGVTSSTYKTLIYDEIIDLIHSVDAAYRGGPNEYFMFSDDTLARAKKLVDTQNRPLWLPSMRDNEPNTIFGKPYVVNYSMPSFSTTTGGLKPLVYGDFSKYWIMDVLDVDVRILRERYAEFAQVAWLGFARADGTVVNRNALKHLLTGTT